MTDATAVTDEAAGGEQAPAADDVRQALAEALGPAAVRAGPARSRRGEAAADVDGVRPGVLVRADSADQAAAALAVCNRLDAVVVPRGGGTHGHLGMPPAPVDVVMDLRGMDDVIAYSPADMTLAAAAGARLDAVQQRLAAAGQMLALDPAAAPGATIGGIIAANRSGPRRAGSGTARDLVIGMEVAGVDGRIAKAGGMVVKNVTGYDLPKAHVGALGTLGIITRVNLKVTPRPAAERTLAVPLPDLAAAGAAVGLLIDSPLTPSGLDVVQRELAAGLTDAGAWLLAVRAAGTDAGVRAQHALAAEAVRACACGGLLTLDGPAQARFWTAADALAGPPAEPAAHAVCRVSSLSSQTPSLLGSAAEIAADLGLRTRASARALHGVARVRADGAADAGALVDFVRRLRTAAARLEALVVLESAPPHVKRAAGVWGLADDSPAVQAMDALRTAFDPRRIINRGRFVVA